MAQGNNTNYVQFNFGTGTNPATGTFDTKFSFNPHGNASTGQDIFVTSGSTSNTNSTWTAATRFRVRYRMNVTQPQVQIQLGTGSANLVWSNLLGSSTVFTTNTIQVVYQTGSLQLYVNGTLVQTLAPVAGNISSFRFGSVTSGGSATAMYFDAFAAKRTISPLYP
jgi:hypothetical protein